MAKPKGYQYRDIYVSLLAYLNQLSTRIAAKYDVKPLTVVNLEAFPDFAKLPEGDLIFISDWTMEVDGNAYGDIHDLMIGFSVINDPNLMRMETIYMNELMLDVAHHGGCRTHIDIMDEQTNVQKGVLVYNTSYEVSQPRIVNSRIFKAAIVQLLSPQRLQSDKGGT